MNVERLKDALAGRWHEPKKRRFLYLVAVVLFILLMMYACSTSEAYLKKNYRIARDTTWSGMDLKGKDAYMRGFTDELMAMIAEIEDIEILLFDVGSGNLFFGMEEKQWDGVLAPFSPASDITKRYRFSEPIYTTGVALITRTNEKISDFSDLTGKIIAFPADIALPPLVAQQRAIFSPYATLRQGIEALTHNRVDAAVGDYISALVFERSLYPGQIHIVKAILEERALRLVTLNTRVDDKLVERFNAALKKLKENGSYHKLLLKWHLVIP